MIKSRISIYTALAVATAFPFAASGCDDLRAGPRGMVVAVVDGDTLVLDNQAKVRLIGMQAPKLPLGRDGFEPWPLGDAARDALSALALGKTVQLRYGGTEADRHGRVLAHAFLENEDPIWLQQAMLEAGMARVYSFADNRFCLDDLYAAEAVARRERRGIWGDPYYQIRFADKPEMVLAREGHYELVEGRILQAEKAGSVFYLNFGRHWREDFTVVIDKEAQKTFSASGVALDALEGAHVRVRGWVDDRDGPRIAVTHPEQIELLVAR
ncbi:thermonuclease family protein [Mariluticola halotolerans]|uniref:thermonuclease family protein n=1 Tax=Mariluticola halotolerans TaxID=2909283 RepID=UPI0026E3F5EC|nr:thermonuclease family protein [Mariluticola halotolerans]UJQ93820.1 thermonuclease family protein [Mariluticola halotolerans]